MTLKEILLQELETADNRLITEAIDWLRLRKHNAVIHPADLAQPVESDLIHIINQRLRPDQQTRLLELRHHLEAETLTESERIELLTLTDVIEQQDAERAKALYQLAQIRNVDLTIILNEFRPTLALN